MIYFATRAKHRISGGYRSFHIIIDIIEEIIKKMFFFLGDKCVYKILCFPAKDSQVFV